MTRMQFGLILSAVGFCLASPALNPTSAAEPAWDPQEVKSPLFTREADLPARNVVYSDPSSTVSKWQRPKISRAVIEVPSATRGPSGVRVSLVSFNDSSVQPPGAQVKECAFASVTPPNGGYDNTCSTSNEPATECSVENTTNGGACSVDADSTNYYCSAGSGASDECSATGSTAGNASCSTNGNDSSCSTNGASGGGDFYCSTSGGSGQTCSTGQYAGGGAGKKNPGQTGTGCSCVGATSSGSVCSSYKTSGASGNFCSADNARIGSDSFCSVTTTGTSDFCSVYSNVTAPASCTVVGIGGTSTCSVSAAGNGKCSVFGQQNNNKNPGTCAIK